MTPRPRRTRTFFSLEALEARLCLSALPAGASTTVLDAATQAHLSAAYGQLPLSFEVNKGQADPRVNFLTQGAGYSAALTPTGAVLSLGQSTTHDRVTVKIVGANLDSRAIGLDKQAGVSNYLIGNDPSKWHSHIANYGEVAYPGVYRGIDLVYHGNQNQLEYDFVVKPSASPGAIRLAFDGIQGKTLDAQGNLILHTSAGDVVEHVPVAYQMVDGVRHAVASRFVLSHDGQVGFHVGHYDHTKPLVIDPTLSYSTYFAAKDTGYAIAVDTAGNANVTGRIVQGGSTDVFVTKFNATGTAVVYSTYLGAKDNLSGGTAIALFTDPSHNTFACVTGYTSSTHFPTKNGVQTKTGGGSDAFFSELNANGSSLVYSTYLGGSGNEAYTYGEPSGGIAVDAAGNAYVTGYTESVNFPVTSGAFQATFGGGQGDAFVTKIDPSQVGKASLVYSTYLGGNQQDVGYGIAVDRVGDAYVTGYSNGSFPVTPGAFEAANMSGAFVTKLNPSGTGLVYSTMLGGTVGGIAFAYGIALNNAGNAYVTGYTTGADFPTTLGAYQTTKTDLYYEDAFLTELNLDGSDLVYSTYLGGIGPDRGRGIAVDGSGNAYITGMTARYSVAPMENFPIKNAFQPTFAGYKDAFVTKVNPSLAGEASLVYSSFLGGSAWDEGHGIAIDGNGNAYLTGLTWSPDFPTKNAYQPKIGNSNTFVTKITAS